MKGKKILAAILILCLGGLIIYGLGNYITGLQQPEKTVFVAVAKKDVLEGSFLTTNDYEYVAIPESDYIYSYVTYQPKQTTNTDGSISETLYDPLKGKEVSQRLYAGERIVKGRINFNTENLMEEAEYNDAEYRRYTYNGSGLENFAGLLKSGDRIDIWIQYTVVDNTKEGKADKIIVTDKIFSNVLISKVLDSSGNEVTASTGAASVLELMMKEKDLQEFITWRAVGKITLVKSSSTANEGSMVDRIKLSLGELADSVISSPEGYSIISNIDVVENSGAGYEIDLNESDAAKNK